MNSNSELAKSIVNNIEDKYSNLEDPEYLSNNSDVIFEYFSDNIRSIEIKGEGHVITFTTVNRGAGCAIFKAITGKKVDEYIDANDEDIKNLLGFTIGVGLKKSSNSNDYNIHDASINFIMRSSNNCINDVGHEDIINCLDIITKKAISILQS